MSSPICDCAKCQPAGGGTPPRDAHQRIFDLRFGLERVIEKTKYDEYGTFEDVRNRIIQLCYEILADDQRAALSAPPADGAQPKTWRELGLADENNNITVPKAAAPPAPGEK